MAIAPAAVEAAGLIAAYERYEPGKGFELGLVNVSTGQQLPLPAGVNTTDDELHPALTPDGRHLVFMRTRLLPKLNGDIVPPPERTLHQLDRQTGTVTALTQLNNGAGPVINVQGGTTRLAFGVAPQSGGALADGTPFFFALGFTSITNGTVGGRGTDSAALEPAPPGQRLEVVHGAQVPAVSTSGTSSFRGRYMGLAYLDPNSGGLQKATVHISTSQLGSSLVFGGAGTPAGNPVARAGDHYVALDLTTGEDADIQTLGFPGETQLTPAPAPITTAAPERIPAWSPDSLKLGFVRTTSGRRTLAIFDATPGLQTIVNPPLDIGPDAPTPQTRAYQSLWGGLSLADAGPGDVPAVTCATNCLQLLAGSPIQRIPLAPRVSLTTSTQKIGIFVARVTGRRSLLGRSVPRIRVVGRVPLGRTRKGLNRFRWNGRVEGRRLKPGRYVLTYRALRGDRVVNASRSIRFTVARDGKLRGVRPLG
jgi:hypothetical protein